MFRKVWDVVDFVGGCFLLLLLGPLFWVADLLERGEDEPLGKADDF